MKRYIVMGITWWCRSTNRPVTCYLLPTVGGSQTQRRRQNEYL